MTWQEYVKAVSAPAVEDGAQRALRAQFEGIMLDRLELGRFAGPTTALSEPLHRWVYYKEAFAPTLVTRILDHLHIREGHVLDPFAGVGTSLLVAAKRGLKATGVELLPYAAFVARVKARASLVDQQRLAESLEVVLRSRRDPVDFPDLPAGGWAFEGQVLHQLSVYRASIDALDPTVERDLLRLALLSIVEEASQATKDGTCLKRIPSGTRRGRWGSLKTPAEVRELFEARVALYARDLEHAPVDGAIRVVLGDARALPSDVLDQSFDIALFSPPYPNRYDYSAVYQLELGFGFIDGNDSLKQLRKSLLRSHLEAPWPEERSVTEPALEEFLCSLLARRKTGDQTGRVIRMVAGYFEDMRRVLMGLQNVLRPGSPVAIVVGTQAYKGLHLQTDLLLAAIGETLGMRVRSIWRLREKGISVQQRIEWGDARTRESLLLLEA